VRKAIRQPDRYPAAQGDLLAISDDSVRYIRNLGTGEEQLFDLLGDPLERHNLAAAPAARGRLAHLRAALEHLRFVP
jgi:hypothetical protein